MHPRRNLKHRLRPGLGWHGRVVLTVLAGGVAMSLSAGCGWMAAAGVATAIAVSDDDDSGHSPQPESVSPLRVANNASFTVTIHGQRLSESPEVWLETESGSRLATAQVQAATTTWVRAHFEVDDETNRGLHCHLGPATVCVKSGSREGRVDRGLFLCAPRLEFTGPYYQVEEDPQHIVALDYDGDGDLDLAVASQKGASVQLLEGQGDGSFRSAHLVDTVWGAMRLAVLEKEDFGETKDRLVVATELDVRLITCEADGGLVTFATDILWEPLEYPEGERRLAVADLEVDGVYAPDDIVVMTEEEGGVMVLWDLGDGGQDFFGLGFNYPIDLAVADFDQDGTEDIVTVSKITREINFFLARGVKEPPVWAGGAAAGTDPESVAAGNLRDPQHWDEYPDVVFSKGSDEVSALLVCGVDIDPDSNEERLCLFPGGRAAFVGRDPEDILLAEIGGLERCAPDDSGDCVNPPDIVVACSDSGDVSVNVTPEVDLGDPQRLPVQGRPKSLALGDFDGDGFVDLAVLGTRPDVVTVLLHIGEDAYPPDEDTDQEVPFEYPYGSGAGEIPSLPPGLAGLDQAHLDGDDWPDFAIANRGSDEVAVILSNDGHYDQVDYYPVGGLGTRWVRIGDMDLDGHLDLVVSNRQSREVSILFNSGGAPPTFFDFEIISIDPIVPPPTEPRVLSVADFDGDGDLDILVPLTAAEAAAFLWNTLRQPEGAAPPRGPFYPEGGRVEFEGQAVLGLGRDPRWADAADLDCDGRLEGLLGCERKKIDGVIHPGYLQILWNDGARTFTAEPLAAWGAVCPAYGTPDELAKDEVEQATGGALGICGSGPDPCCEAILVANRDLITYYAPSGPRQFEDPRWIPISWIENPEACEAGVCLDSGRDPEFVFPFDLNGDGWNDLVALDEEVSRVFVLRNLGVSDTEACVSQRFELTQEIEAGSPQAVQVFEREGQVFLATIHRSRGMTTLHEWIPDEGGDWGAFSLWKTVLLEKLERVAVRDSLASRGSLLYLAQEDGYAVQCFSLEGIGESPHSAARVDLWTLDLTPHIPVALAAGECGIPETGDSFGLAIGVNVESTNSEVHPPPILYVDPAFVPPPPGEGPSFAAEPVSLPAGRRWVALKAVDLGGAPGAAGGEEGTTDLLAASDAGLWAFFPDETSGISEALELALPEWVAEVLDVTCGDLDGDSWTDLVVTVVTAGAEGSPARGSVLVAFGPVAPAGAEWEELPAAFPANLACAGAGALMIGDQREGLIVVLRSDGTGEVFRWSPHRGFVRDRSYDVRSDPVDVRFGDFNLDTLPDFVVANREPGTFTLLVGEGDGTFTREPPIRSYVAGRDVEALLVTDIDGDGADDILVTNSDPGFHVARNLADTLIPEEGCE